jgi:hypothetical protein
MELPNLIHLTDSVLIEVEARSGGRVCYRAQA